ncbi:ABC transporter ATP-binding protein [bacterium]|nr:ABC transporter ATP-binding protein [bacterium]
MIALEGVSKTYQMGNTSLRALKDISFKAEEGEFVAIMGSSGSGKSTLLNILGCLDKPTKGNYLLVGTKISELDDNELSEIRLQKIGFIFQTFNLLPRLTALRNVELPLLYAGAKERTLRGLSLLEKVGLKQRAFHRPTELSGGEQQRVAIARAIANNPKIILADEPTGNLDIATGKEIMEILQFLNKEGATILMVTHEQHIASYAHRQIYLKDGEIMKNEF